VTGLLEGVRVVETGVLMTVDHLGRLLGDEGADVIKVETPQLGDYLRNIMHRFGPDWSASTSSSTATSAASPWMPARSTVRR
jgi:crotonobetainyl-CoA:carnitine CoA-transferase CaiB-like acyl-CoA transferase